MTNGWHSRHFKSPVLQPEYHLRPDELAAMRHGGRRPPGPRPPYNPGQQQVRYKRRCRTYGSRPVVSISARRTRVGGACGLAASYGRDFSGRASDGTILYFSLGLDRMQAAPWSGQASYIAPPMGPAMWGPSQPPSPMHGGGFPGFMPHDQYGPGSPGAWGPFGPGMHPGNAQPRYTLLAHELAPAHPETKA